MNSYFRLPAFILLLLLTMTMAALLACENGTTTIEQTDDGAGERSASSEDGATGDTSRQSVLQGQSPTSDPIPDSMPTITPPSEPGTLRPDGYYHGTNHGLALAQTVRRPSATRDGWVDIMLNMVAIRFGSGQLDVRGGSASVFCFDPADCISVKWGSTNQNEATLNVGRLETAESRKAVNFTATFEVAANATKGSLFFGEHEIPLDLEGDYALNVSPSGPLPAPTPPPSQDPKTAGFFMDEEHGIFVTEVYRVVPAISSPMVTGRVELAVLSLADYDASAPALSYEGGGVCLGKGGAECLEIFWGPEQQFNALLYLTGGEAEAFDSARWAKARWPLPLTLEFRLPANQDSASLMFGDHSIPLDLRGMSGNPVFDYTAHYPEAAPGSVLYESDGKTVMLDQVRQDPESGGLEVEVTANNGSEALDFTPLFLPSGIFSTSGRVGNTCFVQGERLPPGQSASLRYVIPRAGNEEWGHIPYSPEQVKRPDGVVLLMGEVEGPAGTGPRRGLAPAPMPTPVPVEVDPASPTPVTVSLRNCPLRVDIPLDGATPSFVRFDRSGDEGNFWPIKWRRVPHAPEDAYPLGMSRRIPIGMTESIPVVDGVLYAGHEFGLAALDADTGESLWEITRVPQYSDAMPISVVDGVLYVHTPNGTYPWAALDADTGEEIRASEFVTLRVPGVGADGVHYTGYEGGLSAQDVATGEILWELTTNRDSDLVVPHSVVDGVLYVADDRYVYALDAASGEALWFYEIVARHIEGVGLPIAVADGVVHLGGCFEVDVSRIGQRGTGTDCGLLALDAATGESLWEISLDATYRGAVPHSVVDGVLYVRNVNGLHALDAATGESLWRFGGERTNFEAIADGVVYAGDRVGLNALDAATGEVLWHFSEAVATGVADGLVYVMVRGSLYAIPAGKSS